MSKDETEKHLFNIREKVQQGNVVLFLGAGASHAAGGPTGKKLTEMIKEQFPESNQSLDNLIDVCQDVIDTPPYNRNELEEFIRKKLSPLQPTDGHKNITKFDWAAIFTTNFDDIIELAYRLSPQALKRHLAVYSDKFQVNPADRSKVYIFKLMGSITALEGESGQMVLSRADYNRALKRREKYFELLFDFVKTGTMIFIGYSFGDRLVLDIMDELLEMYGKDRLPWSYALLDKFDLDDKTAYMFSSRKIIPVKCGFENFFTYLDEKIKVPIRVSKQVYFKLRGFNLAISEGEARNLGEYFEILNEEKINQDPGKKDEFFMGINKSWGGFKEGWDFKRDVYLFPEFKRTIEENIIKGCIKDRVFQELRKYDSKDNKVILIKGMAGVGKTLMLRRLAYDIYTSGEAPVIFVYPARTTFDYKSLSGFIENLNNQLDQKVSERTPPLKPLIIFDDAASMIRHVNRIKDYLASRGKPALVVAAERTGEWSLRWQEFPFKLLEDNIYEIDENLTEKEKGEIIDHLYKLGYIETKGIFWNDIIEKSFERSFFATIYTLVHPSRKPLNEIIKDQYKNLTDLTQKAFRNICIFHQFNLPMNLELLVRALRRSYNDFYSEVIEKDAAKVIFKEEMEEESIVYRTHHRIIAEKTTKLFFSDPETQKNIFLEILGEAVLSNRKEREICEKLLVEHIGPCARNKILSYDQQREIFRIICEKNPIRSLMHHWGILETDDHNYKEAEQLLQKALDLPREDIESYRGESDQTIMTSLGNLYSHWGIESLKEGETKKAKACFKKAEYYFLSSRHGEFPNAHAYHAHALMSFLRGNEATEDSEKLFHYAEALQVLAMAKDNLNDDDLQPIFELEIKTWNKIGDEAKVTQSIEILKDKFETARGYYLSAELKWRKARGKEAGERRKLSQSALRDIEEGLKYFPNDEQCHRLRAKLLKELDPSNLTNYYDVLKHWLACSNMPTAWLLYELGRTAFILGYYSDSKKFFKDLESGVGIGHRSRSRPRYPILAKDGRNEEFEGRVIKLYSSYDGEIRCDTLRSLRYPIPFRPIACRFTPSHGDLVKFNIEFSYRGPIATAVRKV